MFIILNGTVVRIQLNHVFVGPQLNCESSFNNANGYTIACKDEIKGDDIRKGITKVTCALTDGMDESITQETEMKFPLCCEKKVQSG